MDECPVCGGEIPFSATACPECGYEVDRFFLTEQVLTSRVRRRTFDIPGSGKYASGYETNGGTPPKKRIPLIGLRGSKRGRGHTKRERITRTWK